MSDFFGCEFEEVKMFFPIIDGYYRVICLYNGYVDDKCTNNENSLCSAKYVDFPEGLFHHWDGRNCIKCLCG